MKALLLFHLRVGVRVAVRSFIPLFSAVLMLIMLNNDPPALIKMLALSVFAPEPSLRNLIPVAVLAFILSFWAMPRLELGLNGWIRHLNFSRRDNRRGLLLSTAVTQIPLWIWLIVLGIVAHQSEHSIWPAVAHVCLLLAAAACSALPVRRRFVNATFSLSAAACAFFNHPFALVGGFILLWLADQLSGDLRETHPAKALKAADSMLDFRITWRALGWELAFGYVLPVLVIGATALFASNNELRGAILTGAARFGMLMAIAIFLSSVATKMAQRRPAWPWARSLPISSYRRVTNDALFLDLHALPLLVPAVLIDISAIWSLLAILPFLSIRAAKYVRRIPERRTGGKYILESFVIAGIIALMPWTALLLIPAAIPEFISARNADCRQKVSRWLELHHTAAGDSLSWSNR